MRSVILSNTSLGSRQYERHWEAVFEDVREVFTTSTEGESCGNSELDTMVASVVSREQTLCGKAGTISGGSMPRDAQILEAAKSRASSNDKARLATDAAVHYTIPHMLAGVRWPLRAKASLCLAHC